MVRYGWADRQIVVDHGVRLTGEQQARVKMLGPPPGRLVPEEQSAHRLRQHRGTKCAIFLEEFERTLAGP